MRYGAHQIVLVVVIAAVAAGSLFAEEPVSAQEQFGIAYLMHGYGKVPLQQQAKGLGIDAVVDRAHPGAVESALLRKPFAHDVAHDDLVVGPRAIQNAVRQAVMHGISVVARANKADGPAEGAIG